ncbi:MAG: phosphate ABC transporter permease PstA [Limnohabitans sp.]|jgi:phosphate transport system permease protein|nr:phosphate ABC transporter permease PstA [Limnohabitans sp.]
MSSAPPPSNGTSGVSGRTDGGPVPLASSAPYRSVARRVFVNRAFLWACLITTNIAVVVLAVLLISIFWQGWDTLSWKFITSFASRKPADAGILAPLMGSLWVCTICGLVALPLGIGTAIYLEEFSKRSRFTRIVQTNIMNLAGVPSIVYGILGLTAFARMFGAFGTNVDDAIAVGNGEGLLYLRLPFGSSVLAGGLTLMLVILPVVIISTQEALRAVPSSLRAGALALGATPWQTVWGITLPAAIPGIMTGAILSMSRAIGESAPLLVLGGLLLVFNTPTNLMSDFAILPLQIYNWAGRPQDAFHAIAASAIIVQLGVLFLFNGIAVLIRQKLQKPLQ